MSRDFVRRLEHAGRLAQQSPLLSRFNVDLPILLLLVLICCIGLVVLYSVLDGNVRLLNSQFVKMAIAFGAMIVVAQINPGIFLRLAPFMYVGAFGLLVVTLWVGTEVNGSARWLRLPGFGGFQPSELMKLALPMLLAWYFHEYHLPPRLIHLLAAATLIVLPVVLVALQPDLGTALLIAASGGMVLLLAGVVWRHVWVGGLLGLASLPVLWPFIRDYQRGRIMTLFNPEHDPLGTGWNIIQSKTAIGSGGLFGKGLQHGTQSHLDFLPESRTDFIVAVLAEELGLIGVLVLLGLYLLLVGRSTFIAIAAQDTFGRLLAGSLTFTFFIYVFVNIGMVSGILPVVGVSLPLVSYGGTSMVTLCVGFGLIMSVHGHRRITL